MLLSLIGVFRGYLYYCQYWHVVVSNRSVQRLLTLLSVLACGCLLSGRSEAAGSVNTGMVLSLVGALCSCACCFLNQNDQRLLALSVLVCCL